VPKQMIAALATIALLSVSALPSQAAMMRPSNRMMKTHMYFMRHSLGFATIFFRYHPGPHWDLMHATALHLTAAQIRKEKRLTVGMMRDTQRGIVSLKAAYQRYRQDAMQADPAIGRLIHDVKAVGRAQAYLGYEMIPYHLKGYAILSPSQKIRYRKLARINWMHMMRMMHNMGMH